VPIPNSLARAKDVVCICQCCAYFNDFFACGLKIISAREVIPKFLSTAPGLPAKRSDEISGLSGEAWRIVGNLTGFIAIGGIAFVRIWLR
jgi:hypothetical protein